MKILKITKNGQFYKVKFDNDTSYKFHESVIIAFGFIKRSIEVSEDKLTKALNENNYYLALDKAITYLYKPRSKVEVKEYLKRHYEKPVIDRVLIELERLKLLNELEYAKYTVDVLSKKGFGKFKIINELEENKVSLDNIELAIEEYEEELELINCEKILLKYLPSIKNESKQGLYKKVTNYLKQKGFSNEIITISIEKNQDKLDNIIDEDEILLKLFNKLLKSRKKLDDDKKFKNKVIRSLTSKGFPLYKILKLLEDNYD